MPTTRKSVPVLEITLEDGTTRVLDLHEPIITIGRSVDNVLEIPDPNMSRRHCVIEQRESGEVILTDCNSSNGTKVNEEPVLSQELSSGDEITCGSTLMRFATSLQALQRFGRPRNKRHKTEASPPEHVFEDAATIGPGQLQGGGLLDGLEGVPSMPKTQVAVLTHERDDLVKLLEITKRLNTVHDLRKLLEMIIDAAIELMAAERGFLILLKDGQMKIEIARNMGKTTIDESTLQVSTQICAQVIDSGEAVLTTNAQADERFGRYKSVVGLKLRSILCVPFKIKEETFGTVYLDATEMGAFSKRDVALLNAFSDQAALAIDNARLLHAARRRERIEQELKIASQIQMKLLPRKVPSFPGVELYGWMHSAKEVGGDYYDFVPSRDGNSLFVCIGDVTGKGVPAGLVMASARSALRSLVAQTNSPRAIVIAMNRLLCEDLDQEMFVSFVVLRFDKDSGTVLYTGAGHENLLIWRAAHRAVETRRAGGTVLGMVADERVEVGYTEQTFELAPGDGLLLYTDGVTESIDAKREMFGLERLVAAAQRHCIQPAKQALHGVLSEVLRFKGKTNQRDDITLVVVKRSGGDVFVGEETSPRGLPLPPGLLGPGSSAGSGSSIL